MNVSPTQQLLVLSLDNDGVVVSKEAKAAIVACALFELEDDGLAQIKDQKVRATGELPAGKAYLEPLFSVIEQRQEVDVRTLMEDFVDGQYADALLAALAAPLRDAGYLEGGKSETVFVPTAAAQRAFKDAAEDAVAGKAPMTRDEAAVLVFAIGAGLSDKLFGRAERKDKLQPELHNYEEAKDMDPAARDAFESVQHEVEKRFAPIVREYVAAH